ncbi:MAG: META domain-containing protein [Bacteroidota bacterium]
MKKPIFVVLLISSLFSNTLLAQKSNNKKAKSVCKTQSSIAGAWKLNYLEGEDVTKLYRKAMPKINFDTRKMLISGNNSCNSFSGPIKIDDNKIVFTKAFIQTLRACEGDGEQKFMEALAKAQTFSFSEADKLDLIAGDRGIMQFTRIEKKKK